MEITLEREPSTQKSTPGKLYVDGVFIGYSLEDPVRERFDDEGVLLDAAIWKVANDTAIPSGRYPVVLDHSNRFHRIMPHILEVPGFTSVRIHPGNTSADTEGCVLVGAVRNSLDEVLQSGLAFDRLFRRMRVAIITSRETCFITIEKARPEPRLA